MSQGQWTTPNTGFLDKLRAMAADREELPPDPGTVPVPEGHVRLWHYTPLENVPSIREHGLQRRFARGDAGNGDLTDPSAGMWASTYPPEHLNHSDGHAAVVEFHAHPSEISGNAESPWMAENKREPGQSWEDRTWDSGKLREWNAGHHHVIMRGSVPPEHILAIHEPWHHAARYMRKDDPTLQSYQWVKDDYAKGGNDHLEPYVRGLRALEGSYVPPREYSAGRMRVSDIRRPGEGRLSERPYTQDELAADVRANGVQQPLAIEHLPAHGGPTTFNGLHRLDAAERAGVPDVPVVVKHLPGDYPPMTCRRAATEAEFNAAYDLERSGRWAGEREASLIGHFGAAEDTSYRGQHQGPDEDDGEAMHEVGSGKVYPKDFHEHPGWYIESDGPGNWDSYDKVRRSKDWPSRRVTMYRSMPSPHREVNPGDWVTSSPAYARLHGKQSNPDDDWPVVKFEARADQLRTAGDSINEWSYHGPRISRALVHFSGGKNHRGRGPRGGKSDAALYEHEPPEMYQAYEAQNAERRRRKREEREGRERESARKEASMRSFAVLTNPHTGGHDWYHGSPYSFGAGEFSAHSASPLEYEQDPYDSSHWNSLIGSHFAASHRMAEEFSKGEHGNDMGHGEEGPARNVLHARLELKHPKVYASEHDMDQEAYEHEWRAGNHHDNYHDPDELAEAKEYGAEDELPRTYRYAGHGDRLRAQSEADPEYAAMGHYHPYATGWLNAHPDKWNIAQRHRQRLIDAGHDSIVYGNEFEKHHGTADQHHVCAIPFHGGQVDVTQRHTGEHCIDPESAARQWPGRSQPMPPGFDKEGALDVVAHFEPRTAAGPYYQQKLFHMQPDNKLHAEDSMRHNPDDPQAGVRWRQEHEEGYEQPPETWDDPVKGNRDDDGHYRHPVHGGYYCHACAGHQGEPVFHEDAETAENHETAQTDWDEEYPRIPATVHRGLRIDGGAHLADHPDPEHVARAILHHIDDDHMHWTGNEEQARHYAGVGTGGRGGEDSLNVVLHARKPERDYIETDPEILADRNVYGIGYHDDEEIPLRSGAPVHVTGVSWRVHNPSPMRYPDTEGWRRHDFGETAERTAAVSGSPPEENEEPSDYTLHPEAGCPHCGEPAFGEKGAEPLRFNLGGPDSPPVPSSIARCNNCGETYHADKSADQLRVDREAAEMNHADYERGRREGEELFKHFTPNPTHPMIGWDGARDLVNKWHREEQQFGGPGAVVLPQDNPMARQIREHRFQRVLHDPAASRPVELRQPEEDITRMSALQPGPDQRSAAEERGDRWHEYKNSSNGHLHRGIVVQLPGDLHSYVHDESVPREQRAVALQQHFADSGEGLGMHWTPHPQIAQRAIWNAASGDESGHGAYAGEHGGFSDYDDEYGEDYRHEYGDDEDEDGEEGDGSPYTEVMFHATTGARNRLPQREHDQYGIGWAHSRDEDEFPVRPGSPMRLHGISWKQHEPDYPNEPFEHVDFARPMRHLSSARSTDMSTTPDPAAIEVVAHFDLGHAPEGELSDHLRRLHGYDQDALDWAAHRPAHRRYENNPTGNLEDVHRTEHHVRGGGHSASNEHEPMPFIGLPSEEERRSADEAMGQRVRRAVERDAQDRVRRHHVPGFYEGLHGPDYPFREPQRPDPEENPGDGTSSWEDAAEYAAHPGPIDPVFGSVTATRNHWDMTEAGLRLHLRDEHGIADPGGDPASVHWDQHSGDTQRHVHPDLEREFVMDMNPSTPRGDAFVSAPGSDVEYDPVFGFRERTARMTASAGPDAIEITAHFGAPGHFEFYHGEGSEDGRPRTTELEEHLHGHGGDLGHHYRLSQDVEGAWQQAYNTDPPSQRSARYHQALEGIHQREHDRMIADAQEAVQHGAAPGHPAAVQAQLESEHHQQWHDEQDARTEHQRQVAEHLEDGEAHMHGQDVPFSEMIHHLVSQHGIPHDALPEHRLPDSDWDDPYRRDLEEMHEQHHADNSLPVNGTYRHTPPGQYVTMHWGPRTDFDAEHHLVSDHGFDIDELRHDEPDLAEAHERDHAQNRRYLDHHLYTVMDPEGHLPHHEHYQGPDAEELREGDPEHHFTVHSHDEQGVAHARVYHAEDEDHAQELHEEEHPYDEVHRVERAPVIPPRRQYTMPAAEHGAWAPTHGPLQAPGDEPDYEDTAHTWTPSAYHAPPRSREELWAHLKEHHGVTQSADSTKEPGQAFMQELHSKMHYGEYADDPQVQARATPHQHDFPEGHDPVFGSASGRALVAHFGERGPAALDPAARDTVLAPPAGTFAPVLEALAAFGAWEPQSTAEAVTVLRELEEPLEALREGLRHAERMLEDGPLDPAVADALHEVTRLALAAEEDYGRIARMLPPEASWETPGGSPNH